MTMKISWAQKQIVQSSNFSLLWPRKSNLKLEL